MRLPHFCTGVVGGGGWGETILKKTAPAADRAAQRREQILCASLRLSKACSWCFDLFGRTREILAGTVLEDHGLVLIWHAAVHHRAVPVTFHVRLASTCACFLLCNACLP